MPNGAGVTQGSGEGFHGRYCDAQGAIWEATITETYPSGGTTLANLEYVPESTPVTVSGVTFAAQPAASRWAYIHDDDLPDAPWWQDHV